MFLFYLNHFRHLLQSHDSINKIKINIIKRKNERKQNKPFAYQLLFDMFLNMSNKDVDPDLNVFYS